MKKDKKLGLASVISMAVGTMIGASIFSIFGVGAKIAGQDLPLAFLLSGLFAFIVAYSYARLGGKIVSNAGPIAFIMKGIGDNLVTGALSVMIWLTYVVSIGLFAKGFAGYFLPLFEIPVTSASQGIVIAAIISFFTLLNFFGSQAVGKAEFYIVLIKVAILGVFIVTGFIMMDAGSILPDFSPAPLKGTLHAAVIFFLSYMGFGLITNASENMKSPGKNVPRAIYISISIVIVIYVCVALTAIGNLSIDQIIEAKENALAKAAEPFLGKFGFLLISIGALFSISSALNATLFGGANISYSLAKDGELPDFFERKLWFKSTEGLYITAGLGIVFALLFNMEEIASITSSIFVIIYLFVIFSHFRIAKEYGGNRILILANLVVIAAVFAALMYFQFQQTKMAFFGTLASIAGALLVESAFRYIKKRKIKKEP